MVKSLLIGPAIRAEARLAGGSLAPPAQSHLDIAAPSFSVVTPAKEAVRNLGFARK